MAMEILGVFSSVCCYLLSNLFNSTCLLTYWPLPCLPACRALQNSYLSSSFWYPYFLRSGFPFVCPWINRSLASHIIRRTIIWSSEPIKFPVISYHSRCGVYKRVQVSFFILRCCDLAREVRWSYMKIAEDTQIQNLDFLLLISVQRIKILVRTRSRNIFTELHRKQVGT